MAKVYEGIEDEVLNTLTVGDTKLYNCITRFSYENGTWYTDPCEALDVALKHWQRQYNSYQRNCNGMYHARQMVEKVSKILTERRTN